MDRMSILMLWILPVTALIIVAVILGIFFAIKYFIRYHAKVNGKKDRQQEELDRMKIDDL